MRRPEFARVGQQAPRGVESGLEAFPHFGEVGPQAVLGVRAVRVDHVQRDRRGRQQPVDLSHGRHQPGALVGVERLQERAGQFVATPVEHRELRATRIGETYGAHPPVLGLRLHRHQAVPLQGAQQSADVAGVESEALAQPPYVPALYADLPEQPRLGYGPVEAQVVVVQHAHTFSDRAVEPPHCVDLRHIHTSDFSQRIAVGPAPASRWETPQGRSSRNGCPARRTMSSRSPRSPSRQTLSR